MSLYQKDLIIRSSDVDRFRRLRLSALFTLLQEASIAHTTELGMGREKTLDKGLLWVITMEQARIRRLPSYDEKIRIESWPNPTMHLYFPRSYRILGQGDEILLEASAIWALMDQNTRHIVFPEKHGISIKGVSDKNDPPLPKPPKMPEPSGDLTYTVPYSFLDLNGHMNHTKYLDLAEDLMPYELRSRQIAEIRIEFSSEAKEGEEILLHFTVADQMFALSGQTDKRLFRLIMEYR